MIETITTPVLIIGSGPAGYTAAIYAARAGLNPVLVQGYEPGGQLTVTTDVENFPGFAEIIQGPWLMEQMRKQAENVGTNIKFDKICEVDFSQRPFKAIGESKITYQADSVIVCTGAKAKWLGLPSEEKFRGYGVSGCATCDGFFFRGKKVAVIGGGNTAVEEALYMTQHADEVILVHRRDSLRAEKVLQNRLFKHPKIKVIWNRAVEEILGNEDPLKVTGIRLIDTKLHTTEQLDIDGIFIAIGHIPQTEIFKNILDIDEEGYLVCPPGSTRTNIEGVFAAGDVQDKVFRQAVTAAGKGCMAALEAQKFLST